MVISQQYTKMPTTAIVYASLESKVNLDTATIEVATRAGKLT